MRTATVTIFQDAIRHNLSQVKQRAPHSHILAMVKADAYGHGIGTALPALQAADGIGVACLSEAIEARELGWDKLIGLIEGVFSADEWQAAIDHNCSCVIHHAPQLHWALANIPPQGHAARTVWLKYNTGMNRLGFDDDALIDAAKQLHAAGYQLVLTTHFANADDKSHPLNATQISRFETMLDYLKQHIDDRIQASLCNSAAIINFSAHHHDWVRPGIMLYGGSPVVDKSAHDLNLQPAMQFSARIMAIQSINQGEAVGYGSRWVATSDTKMGLVSIGYGDGYPRVLSQDAYVGVISDDTRYLCPVLGRVAMDMIVIDVSEVPDISLDNDVILWGDMPPIDEVARHAGTISYELMCRLSARPDRVVS